MLLLSRLVVRPGVPPAVVPVRLRWADVRRWVAVPANPFPVPVVVRPVPVVALVAVPVVPAVALVAVPVVPAVALVAVARRDARAVVVAVAKNSSRWTCRPTRQMTPQCPRARSSSNVPAPRWTWVRR